MVTKRLGFEGRRGWIEIIVVDDAEGEGQDGMKGRKAWVVHG